MTTLSAAALVAMFVSLFKPFIETVLPPKARLHDPIVQLIAVLSGIISQLVYTYTTIGIATGKAFWDNAWSGFLAGAGAIVVYHVVTANTGLAGVLDTAEVGPLDALGAVPRDPVKVPYALIHGAPSTEAPAQKIAGD